MRQFCDCSVESYVHEWQVATLPFVAARLPLALNDMPAWSVFPFIALCACGSACIPWPVWKCSRAQLPCCIGHVPERHVPQVSIVIWEISAAVCCRLFGGALH